MGIREKVQAYRKEKAKLKAIERSAYIGTKEKEKQRKVVQAAEIAAEKGIAKAKAGGTWGRVAGAVKKEAARWDLGDGKVEPIVKKKKPCAKRKPAAKKVPAKRKPVTKEKPPQTKTIDGKTYRLAGHVRSKKRAEFIKESEKEAGYKTRMVTSAKWGYLIYTRK